MMLLLAMGVALLLRFEVIYAERVVFQFLRCPIIYCNWNDRFVVVFHPPAVVVSVAVRSVLQIAVVVQLVAKTTGPVVVGE